ncbi:hypothetical protein ARMGADRAFT_309131 [Armillaria gallica]|uniref:Uncharacterized protein n=1 Tax=Armillaria gallica TaxID=47427 RepID=A0A2H3DPM0_ARMGA|nr:hypothetical protein ARMGADRAFT_309131 [Armillaria gallica]
MPQLKEPRLLARRSSRLHRAAATLGLQYHHRYPVDFYIKPIDKTVSSLQHRSGAPWVRQLPFAVASLRLMVALLPFFSFVGHELENYVLISLAYLIQDFFFILDSSGTTMKMGPYDAGMPHVWNDLQACKSRRYGRKPIYPSRYIVRWYRQAMIGKTPSDE